MTLAFVFTEGRLFSFKKHLIWNFSLSLLTVDVNNVMSQLSLVEIQADYDPSLVVEDYNPDCFVLIYAVDDRESFGENHPLLPSSPHLYEN